MRELNGKTAVITGAGSGFGRELAWLCAREGMQLVLADLNEEGLAGTIAGMPSANVPLLAQRCDVADADSVERLAQAAMERFGNVHLLFNNAGVIAAGTVWNAPLQDWQWMFGVNVMGVVHGIRSFVPRMLAAGEEAHVVNTSSLAGLVCPPGMGVYSASKHAVVSLSECLHHDLREIDARVAVSVLCPAYVNTGIADSHRMRPPQLDAHNPESSPVMERTRQAMQAGKLSAADIARITLDGVREGRFYILPHYRAKLGVEKRMQDILHHPVPTNPMQ